MKIYKYTVTQFPRFVFRAPKAARFLSCGFQGDAPNLVLWAAVSDTAQTSVFVAYVVPTGAELDAEVLRNSFLGTVQAPNGLVFHVFIG